MPTFVVPVHEANDCHHPAGSPAGGQFCSGQLERGRGLAEQLMARVRDEVLGEDASLCGNPENINHGLCDTWAERVSAQLPGATIEDNYDHWFIKYKGRFYDAERVNGVAMPSALPYFKRKRELEKEQLKVKR